MRFAFMLATVALAANAMAATLTENFESVVPDTTSYTGQACTLVSGVWQIHGVTKMDTTGDHYIGTKSVRMRANASDTAIDGANMIQMNFDKANGAGTVSFKYGSYSTHSGGVIYVQYSTDAGATWIESPTTFTAPSWTDGGSVLQDASVALNVTGNVRVRIVKKNQGTIKSSVNIDDLSITDFGSVSQAEAPSFNPIAGSYYETQNVALSSATSGATIYYTTDGSVPTPSSPTYTTAIPVAATTTIKAYAVKSGLTDSSVSIAQYTILPTIANATTKQVVESADSTRCTNVVGVVTSIGGSGGRKQFTIQGTDGYGIVIDNSGTAQAAVNIGDEVKIMEGVKLFYASYKTVQFTPTSAASVVTMQAAKGLPAPQEFNNLSAFLAADINLVQSKLVRVKNLRLTNPLPAGADSGDKWIASTTTGGQNFVACDADNTAVTATLRMPSDLGPTGAAYWQAKVRPVVDTDSFSVTGVVAYYNPANQVYLTTTTGDASKFSGPIEIYTSVSDWSQF